MLVLMCLGSSDCTSLVYCYAVTETCQISTRTFSYNPKSQNGHKTGLFAYMKLNRKVVFYTGERLPFYSGVNIVVINEATCTKQQHRFFNSATATYATDLANYLRQLKDGTVVVGMAVNQPSKQLTDALPTLKEWGVDITDVISGGSFTFAAQKGKPENTAFDKSPNKDQSYLDSPRIDITVGGM